MKDKLTLGVALVAIVIAASAFLSKSEVSFGTNLSPDVYDMMTLWGGSQKGNVNSTSTTDATYTMVAGDLVRNGAFVDTYIHRKTGAVATTTNTLVASSSLSHVLPRAGMRTDICFVVATSTGGAGMIIAEGTGWNIVVASSTRVQTSSGLAPSGTVSRTVTGGQPSCGQIVRDRTDAGTTIPGDFLLILTPTYPAQ